MNGTLSKRCLLGVLIDYLVIKYAQRGEQMYKLKVKELADTLNQLCDEGKGNSHVYIRMQDVKLCHDCDCVQFLRSFLEYAQAPYTGITDTRKFLGLIECTRDYLNELDEESKYDDVYITDKYFESVDIIYDDDSLIFDYEPNKFIDVVRKK